ncbi:MAG TPA: dicarboxylate/amino acid:cation symporter [Planctomicrobium sp.]|nr:dicarboxylate/amino acid:cation symporter [Planctomicrobium sp.]
MFRTVTNFVMQILGWPLYLRVLLGVMIGGILGFSFEQKEIGLGWSNSDFGLISGLYVQLLTALATPLIFFAIVDAFVRTNISGRKGIKMVCICAINVVAAFAIGLTILNVWKPGTAWSEKFSSAPLAIVEDVSSPVEDSGKRSLSPLSILRTLIPESILQPFVENTILTVAMLAVCVGAAWRSLKMANDPELRMALQTFDQFIVASFQIILKLLLWMIELAPIAICLAVASVVGASGWSTFQMAGVFLLTIIAGLAIHSFGYYLLSIWIVAGKSPALLFREGGGAILTGLSLNSSLATAPLTLESLRRLGVSDSSARLSACVGTNFNNDGITLYEAMTALFIAQAIGMDMTIAQQITILIAALVGSMGIAGIPNSGLIILALVLKASQLPEAAIQLAIPLVYSIDFLLARLRSAVNVMGDLQVAILLDVGEEAEELEVAAVSS